MKELKPRKAAMPPIPAPKPGEYAHYHEPYLALVPEGDLVEHLEHQWDFMQRLLGSLGPAQADFRYAPDKWSVKEILGHLVDAERIHGYRLLRIARGDETPLAGFDQDAYVREAGLEARDLPSLLEEFGCVRRASLSLLRGLPEASFHRFGTANHHVVSASTLAHLLYGHAAHHLEILRSRYLG